MKIIENVFDIETGVETVVERDETLSEKKSRETLTKEILAVKAKAQAEAEAKAVARQAIADRLGLTADELQVLLG